MLRIEHGEAFFRSGELDSGDITAGLRREDRFGALEAFVMSRSIAAHIVSSCLFESVDGVVVLQDFFVEEPLCRDG